jgi:Fe-S-cluster containining protein
MTLLEEYGAQCNGCGRCCANAGGSLQACAEDLERWRASGSAGAAVLRWVSPDEHSSPTAELWFDPETLAYWEQPHCPWLAANHDGGYDCTIYELRPNICRDFPSVTEQIETWCVPGGIEIDLERY